MPEIPRHYRIGFDSINPTVVAWLDFELEGTDFELPHNRLNIGYRQQLALMSTFANLQTDFLRTIPEQGDHSDRAQSIALEPFARMVVFAEVCL